MSRWSRNILPILSSLLCVTLLVLLSYVRHRALVMVTPGGEYYVQSAHGHINLIRFATLPAGVATSSIRADVIVVTPGLQGEVPVASGNRVMGAPYWSVLCLALAPAGVPVLAYRRRRRLRSRLARGLCVHCGYDLRASGERCPECGWPVPPQSADVASCRER